MRTAFFFREGPTAFLFKHLILGAEEWLGLVTSVNQAPRSAVMQDSGVELGRLAGAQRARTALGADNFRSDVLSSAS